MAALDASIRAALMRSITTRDPYWMHALDCYFQSPESRDRTYQIAMTIAEEDHQRRLSIGELFVECLIGFPPSDIILKRVEDLAVRHRGSSGVNYPTSPSSPSAYNQIFQRLHRLASLLLQQAPSALSSSLVMRRQSTLQLDARHIDSLAYSLPQYLLHPVYQPLFLDYDKPKRHVPFAGADQSEYEGIAVERNGVVPHRRYRFRLVRMRDYIQQTPLHIPAEVIDAQLLILGTYHDSYKMQPAVICATSVVIKLHCDSYAAKLPLCSADRTIFLREVSSSFLPIYLKLMTSEYICVKLHLYDMLLTLAMHMQLVDPHSTFQEQEQNTQQQNGSSSPMGGRYQDHASSLSNNAALRHTSNAFMVDPTTTEFDEVPPSSSSSSLLLEDELCWMFRHILHAQILRDGTDERTWMAALKCTLACIPVDRLFLVVDSRVLRIFCSLPPVASCAPHVFSTLVGALCFQLLGVSYPQLVLGQTSSDNAVREMLIPIIKGSTLCIDDDVFGVVGWDIARDVIHLYRRAETLSSRVYLFCILFAMSVGMTKRKKRATLRDPTSAALQPEKEFATPTQLSRALCLLVDLGLPWNLRPLLFYQSRSVAKELPGHLAVDFNKHDRDIKTVVLSIVSGILELIEVSLQLPEMLGRTVRGLVEKGTKSDEVQKFLDTFTKSTLQQMVCEETTPLGIDSVLGTRRVALQLGFQLIRLNQADGDERRTAEFVAAISQSSNFHVRSCVSELANSLLYLARTQPKQGVFPALLTLRSFCSKEHSVPLLMSIYYSILNSVVLPASPPPVDGDITKFCSESTFSVPVTAAEVIGPCTLWALYWGLRGSRARAVCTARYVLASLLFTLDFPGPPNACVCLWSKVMGDPFPPVSLIAARKISQYAGTYFPEKYEAAVSEQKTSTGPTTLNPKLSLATKIWQNIEAETNAKKESGLA